MTTHHRPDWDPWDDPDACPMDGAEAGWARAARAAWESPHDPEAVAAEAQAWDRVADLEDLEEGDDPDDDLRIVWGPPEVV